MYHAELHVSTKTEPGGLMKPEQDMDIEAVDNFTGNDSLDDKHDAKDSLMQFD